MAKKKAKMHNVQKKEPEKMVVHVGSHTAGKPYQVGFKSGRYMTEKDRPRKRFPRNGNYE